MNRLMFLGAAVMLMIVAPTTTLGAPSTGGDEVQAMAVILDCSGSMAELTTDREPKMTAAKRVVTTLLQQLPSSLDVAFVIYGHDAKLSCEAVKVVRPLGPYDDSAKQELVAFVQTLKPTGQTPIALALKTAGDELAKTKKRSQIVLVTDGMETCGGDPVSEAGELFKRLNFQSIEVVGLAVSTKESAGVASIAEAGKGKFINAKNAKELGAAFQKVVPTVGAIKVEPPSVVVKKTVVSAIVVEPLPKEFGRISGIEVYDAGADLNERGVKTVQQSTEAGVPLILQPGRYDVYVNAYLQRKVRIARELELLKNQTVSLAPGRLIAGVVVKDLGIAGVKIGSIDAVKKGDSLELRNRVQSASRFGEVMLTPPNGHLDIHLTPYLAKPMLLQTVTPKPGEITVIGGEDEEKKPAESEQKASETTSLTPPTRNGPDMTVILVPGANQVPKAKSARGDGLDFAGAFINGSTPAALDEAMTEVATAKAKIKAVAYAPGGGWCILYGVNSFKQDGIPREAVDRLKTIANERKPIKSIAFTEDGGWCVLFDHNGYYAQGISLEAFDCLRKFADDGRELKSISFAPGGGWCILYDVNGYRYRDIPIGAVDEIQRRVNEGWPLKCVAFAPDGGWSVLYSFNGYYNSGAGTKDAHESIKTVVDVENAEVSWVAYSASGSWSVLRGDTTIERKGIDIGAAPQKSTVGGGLGDGHSSKPSASGTTSTNFNGRSVGDLIETFRTGVRDEQVKAALKLGEMGTAARDAIEVLAPAVGSQQPTKLEVVGIAFGGGLAMAQGRADPVRVAAAKALFKIDKEAAIAALERARGCANIGVQVWATKSLENIRGVKPSTAPPKKFKTLGPMKTQGGFKQ